MEALFLRHSDPERIAALLEVYRPEGEVGAAAPEGWPSVPSYPTRVKISPLRVALAAGPDLPRYWPSILSDGGAGLEFRWLLLVEERDRIDLRLAGFLSRKLASVALAAHASEGTDEYGFCVYRHGELESQFFREMEERPTYRVDQELESRGIPYRLCRYRDCDGPGWMRLALAL